MSVMKTTKRKLKVAVGTATLGLMALAGTVKGETAEKAETSRPDKDAITATVNEPEQWQKLLRESILSGASKEEFVKYVDFPPFIPVTKDGQFDEAKAKECAEKLVPYLKVLGKKGETMDAVDAYRAFVKATGQNNVSYEDFKAVMDVASKSQVRYWTEQGTRPKPGETFKEAARVAGMACIFLGLSVGAGLVGEKLDWYDNRGPGCLTWLPLLAAGLMGIESMGSFTYGTIEGVYNLSHPYAPKDAVYQIYSQAYDGYVQEVTKPYVREKEQLDQEKAKQRNEIKQEIAKKQRAAELERVRKAFEK